MGDFVSVAMIIVGHVVEVYVDGIAAQLGDRHAEPVCSGYHLEWSYAFVVYDVMLSFTWQLSCQDEYAAYHHRFDAEWNDGVIFFHVVKCVCAESFCLCKDTVNRGDYQTKGQKNNLQ